MVVPKRILKVVMVIMFLWLVVSVPVVQAGRQFDATPTPTATKAAQTASGGIVAQDGLEAWCLAKGTLITSAQLVDVKPTNTKIREMKIENKVPVITTVNMMPVSLFSPLRAQCRKVFSFSLRMPVRQSG